MRILVVSLLLAASACRVAAIYEDQAGTYDWHRPHVGVATQLHITHKRHIYIVSDDATLARIGPDDGVLAWRRVQDAPGTPATHRRTLILPKEDGLLTVHTAGDATLLRVWRDGGQLMWESPLRVEGEGPADVTIAVDEAKGASVIISLRSGQIKAHTLSGKSLWTSDLPTLHTAHTDCSMAANGSQIFVLCSAPGSKALQLYTASLSDGTVDGPTALTLPVALPTTATAPLWRLAGGRMAAVASDGGLCTTDPQRKEVACTAVGDKALGALHIIEGLSPRVVGLVKEHGVELVQFQHGTLTVLASIKDASAVTRAIGADGTQLAITVSVQNADDVVVHALEASTGRVLHQATIPHGVPTYASGAPLSLRTMAASAAGSLTSADPLYMLVLAYADGTTVCIQGAAVTWVRHDGLTTAQRVLFEELPSAQVDGSQQESSRAAVSANPLALLLEEDRMRLQWLALKSQLAMATPEEAAELARLRHSTSDKLLPYRDTKGFRKMLLVGTATGVYALHSGDGHVLWSWHGLPQCTLLHVLRWKTPHDLQHAPMVLVVLRCAVDVKGVVLEVHSGIAIQWLALPPDLGRVLPLRGMLHLSDGVEQHAYLLLSGNGAAARGSVIPPMDAASRAALLHDTFVWERDDRHIVGYEVDRSLLTLREAWRVLLVTQPGTRILSVSTPDATDPVHSSSKVLGDRTLKFKYVSPNLLFAAVGAADDAQSEGGSITAWVLDATTGRVLLAHTHKDATGPVHAVVSENMVAYHYLRLQGHRYQLSVAELYDAGTQNLTLGEVLLGSQRNASAERSASDGTPIEVLHRSFVLSNLPGLSTMGVTRTQQGLAQKTLLLGTVNGQVYAVDRKLVDPRRPDRPNNKPTAEDMEEGLMPYIPQLPYLPTKFLTTNHHVSGLRGVALAATQLESTSLVASFGRDLHFTRALPSASFDQLQPDFPFALLVVITTALLVVVAAVRRMAFVAGVKEKWA